MKPTNDNQNQGFGNITAMESFRNELLSMNNTWLNMATSAMDQKTDYTA